VNQRQGWKIKKDDKKISFSDAQYCEGDRDDLWD